MRLFKNHRIKGRLSRILKIFPSIFLQIVSLCLILQVTYDKIYITMKYFFLKIMPGSTNTNKSYFLKYILLYIDKYKVKGIVIMYALLYVGYNFKFLMLILKSPNASLWFLITTTFYSFFLVLPLSNTNYLKIVKTTGTYFIC